MAHVSAAQEKRAVEEVPYDMEKSVDIKKL
jgi:hypothetical protein